MRSVSQCMELKSSYSMSTSERKSFRKWLDLEARFKYNVCEFSYLLGWFILDDANIPLSPKEAGFNTIKEYNL